MTQPLCPVQNEWHEKQPEPFNAVFTQIKAGFTDWMTRFGIQSAIEWVRYRQNKKRHSEKKFLSSKPVIWHQIKAWQPHENAILGF